MNLSEIKEQTRDVIIAKYDSYKKGETTKDEWTLYILDLIDNYIKHMIRAKHRTMGAEYEDLMQQGRLAVIGKIDEYDPRRSMPTTYFNNYINEAMKEQCDNKGLTMYYVNVAAKLNKAAKAFGFTDMYDKALTPDALAVYSDQPLRTVLETLRCYKYTEVSLQATSENITIDSPYSREPSQIVLEKEQREYIMGQYLSLTPLEKYLMDSTVLAEGPKTRKSFRNILTEFKKDPAVRALYSDEIAGHALDQVFFEQKLNHALQKIKDKRMTKRLFMDQRTDVELVEQASLDDIEGSFADGDGWGGDM